MSTVHLFSAFSYVDPIVEYDVKNGPFSFPAHMAWIWQHIGGDWTPPPKNLRLLLSSTVVVTCTRVKKNSNWYKIHRSLPLVCITWSLLRFWPTWLQRSSVESMDLLVPAAAECNKRKVGLGHNTSSLVLGSKNLAHQTVTSSPNRSDACGLQKRERLLQ